MGRLSAMTPPGIDALEAPAFVLAAVLHEVPPRDAVLRREHDRIRDVHGGQVAHDRAHLVRLHAENDEILRAGLGDLVGRGHVRELLAAVLFDELEPTCGLDGGKVRTARDHG